MKKIKVFIERSTYGFSAYMEDNDLNYSCIGEGKSVHETIDDFNKSYAEMRAFFNENNLSFQEIDLEFYYDTASFLDEYAKVFSLAGLERITGINQTQLGHYLHNRSKPSRRTIEKMEMGIRKFADNLVAIKFA